MTNRMLLAVILMVTGVNAGWAQEVPGSCWRLFSTPEDFSRVFLLNGCTGETWALGRVQLDAERSVQRWRPILKDDGGEVVATKRPAQKSEDQ